MNVFKKIWHKFLDIFGELHISKYPLWMMYDPTYFKMTGTKILEVLNLVKPGDILIRGYDGYADGYFIPYSENHGRYSHAGIYVGNNEVIHAVSPCVSTIHLIDFVECDRLAILRPKSGIDKAILNAKAFAKNVIKYDFDFSKGSNSLYCFELCAECYPNLAIERKDARILGGLIRRNECYLASSLFESKDLELVFEYNPQNKIDFTANK